MTQHTPSHTQDLDYAFQNRRDHFLWKMSFSHINNPLYEIILKACAANVGMFKSIFFKSQNKLNGDTARAASFAIVERLAIGYCLDSPYFDLQEFHQRFWIWTHMTYSSVFGEALANDIEAIAMEHFNDLPLECGFPTVLGDKDDIATVAIKILQVTSRSKSVNRRNVETLTHNLNVGLLAASGMYQDYRHKVESSDLDEDLFFSDIGSVIQPLERARRTFTPMPDLPFSIPAEKIGELRRYQPMFNSPEYKEFIGKMIS